jgi:gamma-F420-2:alpha-L-glutamate ligase
MHREIGKKFDICFDLKLLPEVSKNLKTLAEKPDFAIVRSICPVFSEQLEAQKIPVFNNSFVSRICNDKGKTIQYIESGTDVSCVPTKGFKNEKLKPELLQNYPKHVIKAADGHGGAQVFRTMEAFEKIKKGIGKSDFIIQPFIHGPGKDVRVYVIGKEIVGAVERTAPAGGFRSNFSLGGSVKNHMLSDENRRNVNKICELFSFGLVGIDFIIDEESHFLLNEIEDVVGARMLYQCNPDIALLEKYFSFILDKILH